MEAGKKAINKIPIIIRHAVFIERLQLEASGSLAGFQPENT
jgi:hypothetical protein